MTRSIWLASYSKSGNTWLRILLENFFNKHERPADINKLNRGAMAGARTQFDDVTLIDSGLLTHDEIDCLRPRAHEVIARDEFNWTFDKTTTDEVWFMKVHDAYTSNSSGVSLLGGSRGADGAIVIVRDPRDVAPSFASHLGFTIDETITLMNDDDAAWYNRTDLQHIQLRQKLSSWSKHVVSWLDQADISVHLVRYENLRRDAVSTLTRVLKFAGMSATDEEISRAIAFSDLAILQEQEREIGFVEAPRRDVKFFRRGKVGGWHDELSREQVLRIETRHGAIMQRLGYELSFLSNLARAG